MGKSQNGFVFSDTFIITGDCEMAVTFSVTLCIDHTLVFVS
jgi:hypothetical protein